MKGILTTGLSVLVIALLAQSAPAQVFFDDADGANGPWSSVDPSFGVDAEVAGDLLPGKNGWGLAHHPHTHLGHRIVAGAPSHPNGPSFDNHYGVGFTQGFGNGFEGCPRQSPDPGGCGSAHAFNLPNAN